MPAPKQTLYEILGLPNDADNTDIGLAYQKRNYELARMTPHDPSAEAYVRQAYEVLSNPKRRAAYDASLTTAAERAAAAGQAPDLVIEDAEQPRGKRWIPLVGAAAAILILVIFALRMGRSPDPPKVPSAPVVEAPKPAPPPPPAQPLAADTILRAALQSTGRVMSYEMSGRAVPLGLAVALEAGAMLTTCHAIPASSQLVVRHGADALSANLSVTDEVLDLCKLTVTGLNARPVEIAAEEPKAGDKIFTLGVNAAGEYALTEGTITQVRMGQSVKLLEVSMPIAPGGSGGPVFDAYGRLVGIATTPHRHGANLHVAISSAWISQIRTRGRPQQ